MKQTTLKTVGSREIAIYALLSFAFIIAFFPVIKTLVFSWASSDDYSHGFTIVPICLYIIWGKRRELTSAPIVPGRGGSSLVVLMLCCYCFSYLAKITTLSSLSLIGTLWAVVWFLFGPSIFNILIFPLLLLLFMIPVPAQLYSMLTIPLQLFVSIVSASLASLIGIPILREGNLIQLPEHTLAVVQACSGLRSLMALLTLTTLLGYLTLNSNLLRLIILASAVPTAIIVNIFRVFVMLLTLQYSNIDLSIGTPHTVFGAAIFLLALTIVALVKLTLNRWDQ